MAPDRLLCEVQAWLSGATHEQSGVTIVVSPNRARPSGKQSAESPNWDVAAARRRLLELREQMRHTLDFLTETVTEDYGAPGPSDRWEHSGYGDHFADNGSEEFERERTLGQQRDYQEHLRLVEHALYKIEHGTYGVCDDCGQPIAVERLQALPEANLCITCKTKQEERGRLRGIPRTV